MRQLTQQEIDDAPSWATHYGICEDGDVLLENSEFFIFTSKPNKKLGQLFGVDSDSKPIPRKEFDIKKHEFSEGGISVVSISDGLITLCVGHSEGDFSRGDIIAMAKQVKLTASDLL